MTSPITFAGRSSATAPAEVAGPATGDLFALLMAGLTGDPATMTPGLPLPGATPGSGSSTGPGDGSPDAATTGSASAGAVVGVAAATTTPATVMLGSPVPAPLGASGEPATATGSTTMAATFEAPARSVAATANPSVPAPEAGETTVLASVPATRTPAPGVPGAAGNADAHGRVPAGVSTGVVSVGVAADASADASADVPASASAAPADVPAHVPARVPADVSADVPGREARATLGPDDPGTVSAPATTAGSSGGVVADSLRTAPSDTPPAVLSTASAAAPTVLSSASSTAAAPAGGPVPVTDQIAAALGPAIARVHGQGDGTHRITLRLQPEALGEVRIVLTVRDGAVRVRLAADEAVHPMLLRETPELHRLLERVGASHTQIVVRELPAGSPADSASSASGSTGSAGSGPDTPAGDSPGRWTARPAHLVAGHETRHGRPDRAVPTDPTTRVRSTGVDVTM